MSSDTSLTDHFFRRVLDNAAIAGFDGYFREISTSWQRTLGWPLDTLLSQPITDFVHPDDLDGVLESRAKLHAGELVEGLRNRYLCADGSYRWFEWRATADVERQLVFAVARDITEQKEREEELREAHANEESLRRRLVLADRLATVGTLAAGMAHEINNPLASMSSNVALLRESLEELDGILEPDKLALLDELADETEQSMRRISNLVQGLRRFSVGSTGQVEQLELGPLVERIIAMTGAEIRQRARLVEDYGLTPPVEADPAELSQAILNLVVNASQAIPAGEPNRNEISIRTYCEQSGWVVFEVADTGAGIPVELKERIFEPFFTTKTGERGTGLGLSISHAVAVRLGGMVEIDSQVGVGTRARLKLPAVVDTEVIG